MKLGRLRHIPAPNGLHTTSNFRVAREGDGGENNASPKVEAIGPAPQTLFEKRRTVLDLRLSKRLAVGAAQLQANVDVYNVLNSSAALSVNSTFGPRWQFPIGTNGTEPILWGRMIQFGAQLTF